MVSFCGAGFPGLRKSWLSPRSNRNSPKTPRTETPQTEPPRKATCSDHEKHHPPETNPPDSDPNALPKRPPAEAAPTPPAPNANAYPTNGNQRGAKYTSEPAAALKLIDTEKCLELCEGGWSVFFFFFKVRCFCKKDEFLFFCLILEYFWGVVEVFFRCSFGVSLVFPEFPFPFAFQEPSNPHRTW